MGLSLSGEIQKHVPEPLSHNLTEEPFSEGEEAQEYLRSGKVCGKP